MQRLRWSWSLLLLVLCAACGSEAPEPGNSKAAKQAAKTGGETVAVDTAKNGMVATAAVTACGGFTLEDAASVLGVAASELEDRSESSSEQLRLCSFMKPGSTEGVGFYLSVSGSIERAIAEMEQGRGMAGFAQQTIDQATGTESEQPALQSAEDIGEEAYFMEVNGTLMVRVANVQIQVFHMQDPEQMKQVGRMVAAGLMPQ
jgi:hypothetical protein